MIALLFLPPPSDKKNLSSTRVTVDFGGVHARIFTIRIKLRSSFPGR